MADDVIHSTQYYLKYINRAILANLKKQIIATWQANSSIGNTPAAIKILFPWQLTLFQSHPLYFNMLVIFSSKNAEQGHKLELTYLYACWIIHTRHHLQI